MGDQPVGTYALGVFLPLIRPYFEVSAKNDTAFMIEFFDTYTDREALEREHADNDPNYSPGATSIDYGSWAGTNKKDLPKLYNGRRRLTHWKAGGFHRYLDQSAFEDRLREIGIDALEALQRDLATEGVYVPEAGDLPRAIVQCLLAIFRANEQKKDLKADPPANQPQFEIFEGIDLAQGRIAGNKLHLGRSTLPWKPAPDIPDQPDGLLEAVYVSQIFAAIGQSAGSPVTCIEELPEEFVQEFKDQRRYFYDAEGVRRNLRDVVQDGENQFAYMKDDLYDGVCDTCRDSGHADAITRMRKTLGEAARFTLTGSVLTQFPSMIKASHKKGMCHMLVNDKRLTWVIDND